MILHITNGYSNNALYKNLIIELDHLGVPQCVYNPIRPSVKTEVNNFDFKTEGSNIINSEILNYHIDRILYRHKIVKILKDIEDKVDLSKIQLIHAHTWYSDGGVAYLLNQRHNIPYIMAVRNTDLNVFYKYLPHERNFAKKILLNAKNIIFISPAYLKKIKSLDIIKDKSDIIITKSLIIPNGIDSFWLNNTVDEKPKLRQEGEINILYVGSFDRGKNVVLLQRSVLKLSKNTSLKIMLHIVGSGGKDKFKVVNCVQRNPAIFKYYGRVLDKKQLKEIISRCDFFAMPSKHETFGLVYIESMTQGLPILYTRNEGIDGLYEEAIGEKISKCTVEEISKQLSIMIERFHSYEIPIDKITLNHNWINIALKYLSLYESNKQKNESGA